MRDRHRSRRKQEGRILYCSPAIKKKKKKRYYLLSDDNDPDSTSWKQNNLKDKTAWVSETKRRVCCHFFPTFSQQIEILLTAGAGCLTVRALIEVCSSSFSMSCFYEAVDTKIVNKDYSAITASPVWLLPKVHSRALSILPSTPPRRQATDDRDTSS